MTGADKPAGEWLALEPRSNQRLDPIRSYSCSSHRKTQLRSNVRSVVAWQTQLLPAPRRHPHICAKAMLPLGCAQSMPEHNRNTSTSPCPMPAQGRASLKRVFVSDTCHHDVQSCLHCPPSVPTTTAAILPASRPKISFTSSLLLPRCGIGPFPEIIKPLIK